MQCKDKSMGHPERIKLTLQELTRQLAKADYLKRLAVVLANELFSYFVDGNFFFIPNTKETRIDACINISSERT